MTSPKLRTLCVMEILLERTDENHILKAGDIIDLAAFAKKTFGMYGGLDYDVTLYCEKHILVNILRDYQ